MIMKQLLLSALLLWAISAQSQTLIADETTIEETKTSVKISTSNDSIAVRLIRDFESKLSRYTVSYKKDRYGKYKEYVMYWPVEMKEELIVKAKNYTR